MNIILSISRIITLCIIYYLFVVNFHEFYKKVKLNTSKKCYILCILGLLSTFFELSINTLNQFIYILYIIPLLFIFKVILKEEWKNIILNITISFLIMIFSESITHLIANLYNCLPNNTYTISVLGHNLIVAILALLFTNTLLKYIRKNNQKINITINSLNKNNIILFVNFIFLILLSINFSFYINKINYSFLILLIITTSLFILVKYCINYINSEYEKSESQKYTNSLLETIDELKIIKHDHDNILLSINGYIATKEYDGLDCYVKDLIKESHQISNSKSLNPTVINQPAIYGIIESKYSDAKKKNIKFNIDVDTNIQEINFNFTQLSRVVGILLDNAIEASSQAESKEMSIAFNYNKNKQADMIEVKNSIKDNIVIDTKKIFNKGVSSKKKKSGIGLWEVKNIISSKDNSQIYANVEDNTFSQTIIIEKA